MSSDSARPLLICLMGPTASGKTELAVQLAQRRGCELVSVDSALVYRGLDIGSAKPAYPHHLVSIREPTEPYSAADFAADARRVIDDIVARGATPLLVGGTMLYFQAYLRGLADMPPADPALREDIAAEAREHGWPHIHARLAAVDPESAARIHPNHSQRLSRALEVYLASGTTLTDWHRAQGQVADGYDPFTHFRVVQFAVSPKPRAVLHQRIAQRFDQMLEAGFLAEVQQLSRRTDLHPGLPALRAVGYRQLWRHVAGECSLDEARLAAVAATRQLAKRQLTWLRKWRDLVWIYTDQGGNVIETSLPDVAPPAPGTRSWEVAHNYLEAAST